jgi:hypothetical protein
MRNGDDANMRRSNLKCELIRPGDRTAKKALPVAGDTRQKLRR